MTDQEARDELPTRPGVVIYVDGIKDAPLETMAYILGDHGVWYPIWLGDAPYIGSGHMKTLEWAGPKQ